MRMTILIGIIAAGLTASGCATDEGTAPATVASQPKMMTENTLRAIATVEAVDKERRILTLRGQSGELLTIPVDPAVKNFDQIQRGDRVIAEFLQEIAVYIEAPGLVLKDETASVMETTPRGDKPSGAAVGIVQRRATVEAIDYERRMVTLRGQDGRVRTIRVSPRLGPLDKISKGDPIVIRHTRTVAVGVAKAAP